MKNEPKETRIRWMRDLLKTRNRHRDDWLARAKGMDTEAEQIEAKLKTGDLPRKCPCCGEEIQIGDDGEFVDFGAHEAERLALETGAEECRQLARAEKTWIDMAERDLAALEASA